MGGDGEKGQGGAKAKRAVQSGGQADPLVALVALSPDQSTAATAFGSSVRVWDSRKSEGSVLKCDGQSELPTNVRVIVFSPDSQLLLTATDDKWVRLWSMSTRQCQARILCPKKCKSAAFTPCGKWVLMADKFGDVHAALTEVSDISRVEGDAANAEGDGVVLKSWNQMGHFCSILTSVDVSADGKKILTSDRDNKVRLTWLAHHPDDGNGSYEIAAYCLGHTQFVTRSLFCGERVASCSGDGSIRLWSQDGTQLACLQLADEPDGTGDQEEETDGTAEVTSRAVVTLAAHQESSCLAACVEGSSEVHLLQVTEEPGLVAAQRLEVEQGMLPMSMAFDLSGRLWVAVTSISAEEVPQVSVLVFAKKASEYALVTGGSGLCAPEVLAALGGPPGGQQGNAAALSQLGTQLRKKRYTEEQLASRKSQRTDVRINATANARRGTTDE